MKKTGCKIICGTPTTLAVKELMMMMMMMNKISKVQREIQVLVKIIINQETQRREARKERERGDMEGQV